MLIEVKIWFQNRRMKWRNSKERELLANGGSRDQTLPNKNNPNPDLSDARTDRQTSLSPPPPASPPQGSTPHDTQQQQQQQQQPRPTTPSGSPKPASNQQPAGGPPSQAPPPPPMLTFKSKFELLKPSVAGAGAGDFKFDFEDPAPGANRAAGGHFPMGGFYPASDPAVGSGRSNSSASSELQSGASAMYYDEYESAGDTDDSDEEINVT
uniref:Homeobox domain-containing protein n=1 Tax=Anopheles epiroticus TaxID=199890 RepID=A0A182PCB3_9DIPT